MFDIIINLLNLFTSSIWGFVGLVLGFLAAFVVWNLAASSPSQVQLATLAYVFVFILCLVLGGRNGTRR